MSRRRPSGGLQMTVRFGRGQPLVPQMNRQGERLAQRVREGLGSYHLRTHIAQHVERIAHDDRRHRICESGGPGFQVLFNVFAHQSQDWLRGQAQFVRDRDADAAATEIQSQQTGLHNRRWYRERDRKPHLRMG